MRGVHCSWVDMLKIRQALAGKARGDQAWLERSRCVGHSTVSGWRSICDVLEAIDGKRRLTDVSHFQPTHAEEIGRHYRRRARVWDEPIRDEIADWVDRCEAEELTVQQLRQALIADKVQRANGHGETCTVDDLWKLIRAGKRFGTVYADPPWRYDNQETRAATDKHYPTMSPEEIAAWPIAQLAAEAAHLHLWTTNAFLFECPRILEAWGFAYKSVFVWVKPKMGIGNYWRVSHEFLILGVRGDCEFLDRAQMSWLHKDRTRHSRKPDAIRQIVEKVSPGPRLELFGREPANGWTVWGNEIERGMFDKDVHEL
jgi:N6-adenosine-specific RNA methylase IME4